MNNEQELIERAKSDDREAFCQLARLYQKRIYALALHYTRDPHNAEDLSQEVWMKAYRSINTFRGDSGFYTWLRQIAVNTLLNHRRSKMSLFWNGWNKQERVALDDVEVGHYIEPGLHQRMMVDQMMQALGELSDRERLIFLLKHREGMTYDEIATTCGVSSGTIKKALFRTVTKLRSQLGVQSENAQVSHLVVREES